MPLQLRQHGDMAPSSDGSLARMQFSPYRVQLAGIQTAAVEYRPLSYAVVTGGFVEGPAPGNRPAVQADVYEKDLALLAEGQVVEVSADGVPRRFAFQGQVRKVVAPVVHENLSARIHVAIDDPRAELRAGLYVTLRVKVPPDRLEWLVRSVTDDWRDRSTIDLAVASVGRPAGLLSPAGLRPFVETTCQQTMLQNGLVLSVLESAVLDTGSKRVVYREVGPGMFEAVEVVVGPRCGEFRPLIAGLQPGQRVVAAGAVLLDAETRLNPSLAVMYFGAARNPAPGRPADAEAAQNLAKLAPRDRALAIKQKVCPVTGALLGSAAMGVPYRIEVAGRTVFLCCEGCESKFRRDLDKYLSKLPAD
jgi:hypothetical protein